MKPVVIVSGLVTAIMNIGFWRKAKDSARVKVLFLVIQDYPGLLFNQ